MLRNEVSKLFHALIDIIYYLIVFALSVYSLYGLCLSLPPAGIELFKVFYILIMLWKFMTVSVFLGACLWFVHYLFVFIFLLCGICLSVWFLYALFISAF